MRGVYYTLEDRFYLAFNALFIIIEAKQVKHNLLSLENPKLYVTNYTG